MSDSYFTQDSRDEDMSTDPDFSGGIGIENNEWMQTTTSAADNEEMKAKQEELYGEQTARESKDQGFIANNPIQAVQEVGSAIIGGAADAVESVGSFADLTGDTLYTGLQHLWGEGDMDPRNNPFHEDYQEGNWFDIPDQLVPENHSGMGKLVRGLAEFGLITYATGGIGAAAKIGKGANLSRKMYLGARAAGTNKWLAKNIAFIPKGAKIASEGAIADFITKSSEYGNIANLIDEHLPIVPFAEMLAVDPEKDNPWVARTKTMFAGAGANLTGHFLVGFGKAAWKSSRAKLKGMSDDAANEVFNRTLKNEIREGKRVDAALTQEEALAAELANEAMLDANANYFENFLSKWLDEDDFAEFKRLLTGDSVWLTDTRGKGVYYHGRMEQFNINNPQYAEIGPYGTGFYTTEDLARARGQSKSVEMGPDNPLLYKALEKREGLKLVDLDEKLSLDQMDALLRISKDVTTPDDIADIIDRAIDEVGFQEGGMTKAGRDASKGAFIENQGTLGQVFEEVNGFAQDYRIKQENLNEYFFRRLRADFEEKGFSGYARYENKVDLPKAISPRTIHDRARNRPKHRVRLYWNPATDLDLTKLNTDAMGLEDLIDLAKRKAARGGDPWDDAKGLSASQETAINKATPSPSANKAKFNESETGSINPTSDEPVKTYIKEAIENKKQTGKVQSSQPIVSAAGAKTIARGDYNTLQYLREAVEDVVDESYRSVTNVKDKAEIRDLIMTQFSDFMSVVDLPGDKGLKAFRELVLGPKNRITYEHNGVEVVTTNWAGSAGLKIVINSLIRNISDLAGSAGQLPKGANITKMADEIYDRMKIALVEQKKAMYMAGAELEKYRSANQNVFDIPEDVLRRHKAKLKEIQEETESFVERVKQLTKEDPKLGKQLLHIYHLSDGQVRHFHHIGKYLDALTRVGRPGYVDGKMVTPRINGEIVSTYYNSILSSPMTGVRAVFGTNLIGLMRPLMAYAGAMIDLPIPGFTANKTEMAIAAAQIDGLGRAWAEGIQMFVHNWKVGVNRGRQTYIGRFDTAKDIKQFEELGAFYDEYGTAAQKQMYSILRGWNQFNTSPWTRYSQTIMGSGDAMARTILGRYDMRMAAARQALQDGVPLDQLSKKAAEIEENFRKQIFKKGDDNTFMVSDEASMLAGNEAAMTQRLPERFRVFESLNNLPLGYIFFPFVKTGYNALRISTAHTPLEMFSHKWRQVVMDGSEKAIQEFGIKPENLEYERALMKGRVAAGSAIIGMAWIASTTGVLTGDLPMQKEQRDLWKINGIQPYSFKIGDAYVSYRNLEPFNTILAMTANVATNSDVLGKDLRDEWGEKLVWMLSTTLVDKSMLAGVEDLATLMNADSAGGQTMRIVGKIGRSHLPWAGMFGHLGDTMQANEKEANNLLELILKRDIALKELVPPKYDILSKDRSGQRYIPPVGNPILKMLNSLSPIAITWPEGDPVKMTLNQMSYNIPEVVTQIKGEPLNSLEISQLSLYMSQGDLRRDLEKVMNSAAFKKDLAQYQKLGLRQRNGHELYKQRFYRMVDKQFRKAKKIALAKMLKENPELSERINQRLVKESIGKSGQYQKIQYLINEFPK